MTREPAEIHFQPELHNTSLIVGWQEDAGKLGLKVIEYLNSHMKAKIFSEIEPVNFFPLAGIAIENNIAQFPVSRFYTSTLRNDLIVFESTQPPYEQYKFLNSILDVGECYCKVKELYTVSGTVSPIAHTSPRRLLAVFNQLEFQRSLRSYDLEEMTWEGVPAINSFLLWLAQRRGIPGVSLWPEVSFYLAATEDPKATKAVLSFFDKRFDLGLDLTALDSEIKEQSEKLAQLRKDDPQVDRYIRTLEVGLTLDEEEQLRLVRAVTEFLERTSV